MSEQAEGQVSQEGIEAQEQDPEATEEQEQEEQGQEPQNVENLPEWAQKQIKELRNESAQRRTKLKEYEDRDKSEADRVAEERDTLKTENEQLRNSVRRANFVQDINLPSPRLAYNSLSDLSVDLEWDEKDRITNLDAIRKALKQEFPREFGDGNANGGDRGPAPQQNDMNSAIRAAAGRG